MSGAGFQAEIDKFIAAIKQNGETIVKNILHDVADRLVDKTPVETGHLKANWQCGEDTPPSGELEGVDPSGAGTKERLHGVVKGMAAGHKYYFVNNCPYMSVIEYGHYPNPPKRGTGKTINGYSTQAPHGVIQTTIDEFQPILQQAIRNAK